MSDKTIDIAAARSHGARNYGAETRSAKDPFVFSVGDSPEFTVHEPDAYTVMDIEEASTSRAVLKLFLGDQFNDVEDHLGPLHPDTLLDLARDLSRHFGLFDADAAVNRSERRRRDRTARRR